MIYGDATGAEVVAVHQEMGLPEPFIFPWRDAETGKILGMITGLVKIDPVRHLDVDHMIVLPRAARKLTTMMQMSEAATQAAFCDGCAYILISIFLNDSRRSGLRAWAKRMGYKPFGTSEDAEWFVRHNERLVYDNGQGREGTRSEAASSSSRSER